MEKIRASVIIPMYNSSRYIDNCLLSVEAQTAKDIEVILVDDSSTDDTVMKAESYPFKIIRLKERVSPGEVRNIGAKEARADIFIFLDADVVMEPDSIEDILHLISQPQTDAISAIYTMRETPQADFFSQFQNLILVYRYSRLSRNTALTCSFFCAIKRPAFEAIKGYNHKMLYYEDIELGNRLTDNGFRCKFTPEIEVTHLKYYDHFDLLRDYFYKAATVGGYIKKRYFLKYYRENGWPVSIKIASLCSGLLLFSLFLVEISPLPFLILLSVYAICIAPLLYYLAKNRNLSFVLKSSVVLFEVFLVSVCGLGFGFLRGKNNA